MKPFLFNRSRKNRGGFSLVEATLSIGILSFAMLSLSSLLALGLKDSRHARDDRETAQIAQTLVEEARQGRSRPARLISISKAPPAPPRKRFTRRRPPRRPSLATPH